MGVDRSIVPPLSVHSPGVTLAGVTLPHGGGGGACEAESGEGCRGEDCGEDSSNAHLVRLSQIASVGTLLSQLFIHVGDTSCWAVRLTLLSGAGSVTRPVRADGSPCHIRARKSGSQRSRAVKRDASR